MNVLSIGNSFSQDAQRYIHGIARADGEKVNVFNLYIGGCSLARHYRNMLSGEKIYSLEMNGVSTGFFVSLSEALLSREWDVVTLQQASPESTDYKNYQPYLDRLTEYVRRCSPKAKIVIHETWAYEDGSQRLCERMGYSRRGEMFEDLSEAYALAAKAVDADLLIPSGELFEKLVESGITEIHRDTFHASLGIGRYALGLLWYAILTGNDISDNEFCDFDEEICREDIELIKECVTECCEM
ncbi:MAG: DUF4886 domain-containing protein [Ruminococcaceae bacterium]|nr:DUF4886 domain-containing protein [Oscillospiraceae bacterium]